MQKLTVNLQNSILYGQKAKQELKNISDTILETKISIGLLHEQLINANAQSNNLELTIKRQEEQISNHEYKKQKLQIRLNEQTRKLQLQEQILDKKINYQNNLKQKIKIIEENIQKENAVNLQNQKIRKDMDIIDTQIQKSIIQLQNLYQQIMNKNKILRQKEDKVYFKKNSNLKKRNMLAYLTNALENQSNKQNNGQNALEIKQLSHVIKLENIKSKQNRKNEKKIKDLLSVYRIIDELLQNTVQCKKHISKFEQMAQQSKIEKNSISKLIQENQTNN